VVPGRQSQDSNPSILVSRSVCKISRAQIRKEGKMGREGYRLPGLGIHEDFREECYFSFKYLKVYH
jgi:hypothetical protein